MACDEWFNNPFAMVDYVLSELGHREPWSMLALRNEAELIGPGNLEYVPRRYKEPSRKRRFWLARQASVEQACVCDDRGEEMCWSSGRPCEWLIRKRLMDLWDE